MINETRFITQNACEAGRGWKIGVNRLRDETNVRIIDPIRFDVKLIVLDVRFIIILVFDYDCIYVLNEILIASLAFCGIINFFFLYL